ncbi:MAG: hypothetical protein ACO3RV_06660, partial [Luteolibacter sp.]
MNTTLRWILGLFAVTGSSIAQPDSKPSFPLKRDPAAPRYIAESPLPEGWPEPGPFNQVTLKKYPAYRAAFSTGASPNGEFMTLFRHIKKHNIPMTAPVEMTLDPEEEAKADMEQMAFLYQNTSVGEVGADGDEVEVRDVPAAEALSYSWQGPRSNAAQARKAV